MKEYIDNLKRQANENPIGALVVGALVATAAAKLLQASTERKNSYTWSREVDRRRKNSR